jgi:tetratricopeptide (TPR) repeat protein
LIRENHTKVYDVKTHASKQSNGSQVFMSHASADSAFTEQLVRALEADGFKAWIDHADVQFGGLLRSGFQAAIGGSRAMVLVWSKSALDSRWVNMEIQTAFHLDRFIIPCVLDTEPLPQFLQNAAYLDERRDKDQIGAMLCRAVRGAPDGANKLYPLLAGGSPDLDEVVQTVAATQRVEMEALGAGDFDKARKTQAALDEAMPKLEAAYPLESNILNVAAYNSKNAYMLKHWDAIQAGRAPKDPLLQSAERRFFDALRVNPEDPSALNGLGSILMFERELDTAEFFQRRAIEMAKRLGSKYPEAEHDLALILHYRKEAGAGH